MAYTGHKQTNMPDGKTLVEWITPVLEDECRHYNIAKPSPKQIAVVISALRMHTIMMHAASYDIGELGRPAQVTEYWPIESSIGRYFRDASRVTLDDEEES